MNAHQFLQILNESSSYAKVLFEYNREQITEVLLASDNKYEIKYGGSTTGMMIRQLDFK